MKSDFKKAELSRLSSLTDNLLKNFKKWTTICPVHGKVEFSLPSGHDGSGFCPQCVMERRKREKLLDEAHSQSARQTREINNLFHPVALSDIENFTFDNFIAETEKERRALSIVRRFAERFTDREVERLEAFSKGSKERYRFNTTGLFLIGKSGTGKTHLCCAVINELKRQGFSTAFMTAEEMVKGYTGISYAERPRALSLMSNVPVLIIDEVGRHRNADVDQSFFWSVINDRIRFGRPTIYVTNFEAEELMKVFDDSVFSRLGSSVYQIACNWESRRPHINGTKTPEEIF